jgi:hypothetical protein
VTPTIPILYAILLQAVKDMAYRPGRVVNGFALVDGMPKLDHISLGYTYEDFKAGRFWSRGWAAGGGDPSKIAVEYPVLMPELVRSRRIGGKAIEHTVDLTLVDTLTGQTPAGAHCKRAGAAVYSGLLEMGLAIVSEAMGYGLWQSPEGEFVWGAGGRIPGSYSDHNRQLSDYVTLSDEVRPWGDYPHLRGLYMSLTLKECIDTEGVAFRYDQTEGTALGVVNCEGRCC